MLPPSRLGFTLIELSIVLVIIGLIVGGVMVGRDLIDSARIRAQISQFERYGTAFNTFRLKYNCIPGDCSTASQAGLGTDGNGNGILEAATQSFTSYTTPDGHYDGEFPHFFLHLIASGFIKEILSGGFVSGSTYNYPVLAISDKAGMIAGGKWQSGGTGTLPPQLTTNYNFPDGVWLHAIICNDGSPISANDGCGVMTPAQAYAIDTKLDDGNPIKGKIWSYTSAAAPAATTPCLNGTYSAYSMTNTNPNCQMSVKIGN